MGISITTGVAPAAYANTGATTAAPAQTAAAKTPAPAATPQPAKAAQAPTVQTAVQSQAAEKAQAQQDAKKPGSAAVKHKDAVTITYDSQAGVNVFKEYDSKGNVVVQVPPSQLLKTMQLEGKSNEEITGKLINTKA
jgi:Rieske Fe-S protein